MQCPRCQQENPQGAKCCLGCGVRLALMCAQCNTELPPGAKFCLECRPPVTVQPAAVPGFTTPETYTPKHLAGSRRQRRRWGRRAGAGTTAAQVCFAGDTKITGQETC
jgi:ribosomal protein L40E